MKRMFSSPALPKFPMSPKLKTNTKSISKKQTLKPIEKRAIKKKIANQENENILRVSSPKTSSNLIHRLSIYATQINSAPTVVRID
jgi:hypothetical protein